MSTQTMGPELDLQQLLGKPLAVTTQDGRLFIGCFHCTDPQMNIILVDTEEFPPAPRDADESNRRDWEEIWLPRSQRLEGDSDWSHLANSPSSVESSITTSPLDQHLNSKGSEAKAAGQSMDGEGSLRADADAGVRRVSGDGRVSTHRETMGTYLELEARDLEREGSDNITDSASDKPISVHGQQVRPNTQLEGRKWGYGRGPGRYTGMVLIPGRHVVKVELVHGDH